MGRRDPLAPAAPPQPKRTDSIEIVEAIITATCALADPEMSINDIAAKAGVGVASIYRYFPNRGAIYAEIARRLHVEFLDKIRRLLATDGLSVDDAIAGGCELAVSGSGVSRDLRHALNVWVPMSWSKATADRVFATHITEISRWLATRLDPLPSDLEQRVFMAFSAVRGIVLMWILHREAAPSEEQVLAASIAAARAVVFAA